MVAIVTLPATLTFSTRVARVIRIAAVALMPTGLSLDSARFQTREAGVKVAFAIEFTRLE